MINITRELERLSNENIRDKDYAKALEMLVIELDEQGYGYREAAIGIIADVMGTPGFERILAEKDVDSRAEEYRKGKLARLEDCTGEHDS